MRRGGRGLRPLIPLRTPFTRSFSVKTLQPGDVVLIRMQFYQATGSKVRPAVVLLDTRDEDFIAAPVTTQPRRTEYDRAISEWETAGLNVAPTIRLHKLTVLAKADIARLVGHLSSADATALANVLCQAFGHSADAASTTVK